MMHDSMNPGDDVDANDRMQYEPAKVQFVSLFFIVRTKIQTDVTLMKHDSPVAYRVAFFVPSILVAK